MKTDLSTSRPVVLSEGEMVAPGVMAMRILCSNCGTDVRAPALYRTAGFDPAQLAAIEQIEACGGRLCRNCAMRINNAMRSHQRVS